MTYAIFSSIAFVGGIMLAALVLAICEIWRALKK